MTTPRYFLFDARDRCASAIVTAAGAIQNPQKAFGIEFVDHPATGDYTLHLTEGGVDPDEADAIVQVFGANPPAAGMSKEWFNFVDPETIRIRFQDGAGAAINVSFKVTIIRSARPR